MTDATATLTDRLRGRDLLVGTFVSLGGGHEPACGRRL
jgi:hypothetical protein